MTMGIQDEWSLQWYYSDGYEQDQKNNKNKKLRNTQKPFWKFW